MSTPTDTPPRGREIDPDDFGLGDTSPLRCAEPGCTNTLTYSGRGRKPTRCDEHKSAGSGTRGPRSWPGAADCERALTQYINGLGIAVKIVDPFDGQCIAAGSGPVAHELVELAKTDRKLRTWLERLTKPGKYGPLTMAIIPIVLPILAHHKLLPQFDIAGLTPTHGEGVRAA